MKDEDVPEKVTETLDLDGKPLMPGFIDVQVNGGGTLFNDAPGVDAIRTIGRARRASGVVGAALEVRVTDDPTRIFFGHEFIGKTLTLKGLAPPPRKPKNKRRGAKAPKAGETPTDA